MNFKSEKGLALPAIIIIISILLIICTSALYVASNQTIAVEWTKTSEDALHIAEAGYYRYLWQLNDHSDFYKLAAKVVDEFDPLEFYSGSEEGASSDWAGYPRKYKATEHKSGAQAAGYYQIEIVPPSAAKPVVTIRSTGWTADRADIKRAIEVKVHKRKFTNYMDFSGDSRDVSNQYIPWGTGTEVHGPVFTNGYLSTQGTPIFYDTVTYCTGWRNNGNPEFKKDGQPAKGTPLAFPASNADIVSWADEYTYEGRTCILLNGSSLNIRNPNISSDAVITRALPANGVIYVKGELFISGRLDGRLTIVADDTIYITGRDPTNFTYSSAQSTGGIKYANQNIPTSADSRPSNPSDDMLGLISNDKILINVSYWPREAPYYKRSSNSGNRYATANIIVQAALMGLSNNGYFGADDYSSLGEMGKIQFIGSKIFSRVAATRISSSNSYRGYLGDYSYDYRMLYETPPHFLEPANSGWEVREWHEY